jgi:hypothetical protein
MLSDLKSPVFAHATCACSVTHAHSRTRAAQRRSFPAAVAHSPPPPSPPPPTPPPPPPPPPPLASLAHHQRRDRGKLSQKTSSNFVAQCHSSSNITFTCVSLPLASITIYVPILCCNALQTHSLVSLIVQSESPTWPLLKFDGMPPAGRT